MMEKEVWRAPIGARELLSRLEGVRNAGRGWRARCPAHGGHSNSLAISESDTGRLLVHCHAGCAAPAVLQAVGLSFVALRSAVPRGDRVVLRVAAYRGGGGEVVRHREAAARADALWTGACEALPTHPYLRAKRVGVYGIRQNDRDLLVPLRDETGLIFNVQRITPSGRKLFQAGARKRGLWHLIGGPVSDELCIAEGYATAASVHAATGRPVAVAFDAGNLEPVARALRAQYPAVRITVCADDDAGTAARIGRNPGMDAALIAARAVGGCIARPVFGGEA